MHNPPAESTPASLKYVLYLLIKPLLIAKAFARALGFSSARSKDAELEKIYGFLNLSLESFSAKLHFVRSSLFSG